MDWLVVGLGNPGKEYSLTPHNVGFMVCDSLSFLFNFKFKYESRFKGFFGFFYIQNLKIGALKPTTYMNLSGISVASAVNFFKLGLDRLVVVHDDIDLPLGRMKIKKNSSSGGHKGVQSIIDALDSKDFIRVKIGVGKKGDASLYVLSKFGDEELEIVRKIVKRASDAVVDIIEKGLNRAMSEYNKSGLEVKGEGI